MSLQDRLTQDMKTAMKAGDKLRLGVVRMLLSDLKKKLIDDRAPLDEAAEIALLQRALKQRREAAEAFEKGGRPESAAAERAEGAILETYLPEQLGDAELDAAVRALIAETGAAQPGDVGKLIGPLMKRFAGRVDGNRVRSAVEAALRS